jgi:hypothetical protein
MNSAFVGGNNVVQLFITDFTAEFAATRLEVEQLN